jgi:hypothetical protein
MSKLQQRSPMTFKIDSLWTRYFRVHIFNCDLWVTSPFRTVNFNIKSEKISIAVEIFSSSCPVVDRSIPNNCTRKFM